MIYSLRPIQMELLNSAEVVVYLRDTITEILCCSAAYFCEKTVQICEKSLIGLKLIRNIIYRYIYSIYKLHNY